MALHIRINSPHSLRCVQDIELYITTERLNGSVTLEICPLFRTWGAGSDFASFGAAYIAQYLFTIVEEP